jgi:hypothetical protein
MKNKLLLSAFTVVFGLSILLTVNYAFADVLEVPPTNSGTGVIVPATDPNCKPGTLCNPLKVNSIGAAVNTFVSVVSYIAVLVGVIMLIWVGLQFILAQGNSAKIKDLKNYLLYIVIGIALIIGARIIIQVVLSTLEATGAVNTEVMNSANKALDGK